MCRRPDEREGSGLFEHVDYRRVGKRSAERLDDTLRVPTGALPTFRARGTKASQKNRQLDVETKSIHNSVSTAASDRAPFSRVRIHTSQTRSVTRDLQPAPAEPCMTAGEGRRVCRQHRHQSRDVAVRESSLKR